MHRPARFARTPYVPEFTLVLPASARPLRSGLYSISECTIRTIYIQARVYRQVNVLSVHSRPGPSHIGILRAVGVPAFTPSRAVTDLPSQLSLVGIFTLNFLSNLSLALGATLPPGLELSRCMAVAILGCPWRRWLSRLIEPHSILCSAAAASLRIHRGNTGRG